MILTPFDTPCMMIENLPSISAKDLFSHKCIRLKDESTKKYIDFYNKERFNRYGYEGILPAEYTYEYNKIKNDWSRKILTVGVDSDVVVVVIKHVQMFQHIYKRMEGLPLSINGNTENEEKVFDILIDSGLIKKVLVIQEEELWLNNKKGFDVSSELKTYNYYTLIDTHWNKINSNKWKHRIGTENLKDPLLTYRILTKKDNSVEIMNNAFELWKKDIEKTKWLSTGFTKAITKYPYWNDSNVEYCVFEYDGFPVGLLVYLVVNNEVSYQLINRGISHMMFEDETSNKTLSTIPDRVKKRIGSYMHYIRTKNLHEHGVKVTYAGGVFDIRKPSLGTYKKEMNDSYFGVKVYEKAVT